MESDIRFFSRRACEEMAAANRAVTPQARERRLQLVDAFVQKLEELKAPNPFDKVPEHRAAFDWRRRA